MSYLPGKAVMAVNQFSVNNESAAKSGTKGYNNKILHPFSASVNHFTHCGSIGIVRNYNRKIGVPVKNFCERHNSFPGKACGMFYSSLVDVSHRSTNTESD